MHTTHRRLMLALALLLLGLLVASCAGSSPVDAPVQNADVEDDKIVNEVLAARDAVLDFMREGAIISVPQEGAPWTASDGPTAPGYKVDQFSGNNVILTVTYEEEQPDDAVYHVTLNNLDFGLCWQANVDDKGEIIATGMGADMFAELIVAAADHCVESGFSYVRNPDEENQCGSCVYPDNSTCNAWAYFQGFCQPGDRPED